MVGGREVVGDPNGSYKIRHDYAIVGWDPTAGTLDMVVRWRGDGGHGPIHRHVATTTVLVLAGEQHLWDVLADGRRGPERVRRAGDYALSTGDAHAHLESGRLEGGLVFFGDHASNGVLYEIRDENGALLVNTTIESLVADWQANAV